MGRDSTIHVEHLSKEYRLGVINHRTLRHDLGSWWARVRGKPDPNALVNDLEEFSADPAEFGLKAGNGNGYSGSRVLRHEDKELTTSGSRFFALDDVNFEVEEGETFGIIGDNGAGKSTLLKILCRITAPTSGNARI